MALELQSERFDWEEEAGFLTISLRGCMRKRAKAMSYWRPYSKGCHTKVPLLCLSKQALVARAGTVAEDGAALLGLISS